MNCFPCCGHKKHKKCNSKGDHDSPHDHAAPPKPTDMKKRDEQIQADPANIKAQNFTFRELAVATKNFRQDSLLGEGGFGRVYKGTVPATGQVIAVKQLDRHGMENSNSFLVEVAALSLLNHRNLVNLIGYCADGDQRLLVYEYFPGATLEDRLFENKPDKVPLNWFDRMKIASGASQGLEYLHDSAHPPVIYRDLKASNILVDAEFNSKLYDYGMAKLCGGDKMGHAPPRVMGTYGYCAPEYMKTGNFSLKSDVYSFGVVMLELITGRRAIDTTRPNDEQNLVSWAQPLFRDPKKYPDMADPVLNKNFPEKDLNQVVAIAAMCLQDEPEARPLISDVVTALSFLSTAPPVQPPSLPTAPSVSKESAAAASEDESGSESESESESESGSEYEEDSGDEDNGKSKKHVAGSAKHHSDIENDHHHAENKNKNQPQENMSSKSRSGRSSDSGGDGTSISNSSSKSSRKWKGLVGKMGKKSSSKKSSTKELSQKSSKKSSKTELGHKSSKKSSAKALSHKSSKGADGASNSSGSGSSSCYSNSFTSERSSSKLLSQGTGSMRSDDGGSGRHFNPRSSSGSDQ